MNPGACGSRADLPAAGQWFLWSWSWRLIHEEETQRRFCPALSPQRAPFKKLFNVHGSVFRFEMTPDVIIGILRGARGPLHLHPTLHSACLSRFLLSSLCYLYKGLSLLQTTGSFEDIITQHSALYPVSINQPLFHKTSLLYNPFHLERLLFLLFQHLFSMFL